VAVEGNSRITILRAAVCRPSMTASKRAPPSEGFEAVVVRYSDAPNECTIYPRDVTQDENTTWWISAREGSFCSLDDWA
jgi:hypothetical protein